MRGSIPLPGMVLLKSCALFLLSFSSVLPPPTSFAQSVFTEALSFSLWQFYIPPSGCSQMEQGIPVPATDVTPCPSPTPLPSLQLYFCDMFVSYEPCIPFTLLSIKRRPRFRKEQRQNIPALKILIGKQTADMDSTGLTSSDALSTTFLGHSAHRDPSGGSLVRGTTSLTVAGRIGMGLQSFWMSETGDTRLLALLVPDYVVCRAGRSCWFRRRISPLQGKSEGLMDRQSPGWNTSCWLLDRVTGNCAENVPFCVTVVIIKVINVAVVAIFISNNITIIILKICNRH